MYYRNRNIGFMIRCEVQGTMRPRVCLGVKHTFTNGGRVEGMKPNNFQVHFHFGSCTCVGVANVQSLGWKSKQSLNWAPRTPLERSSNVDV